jgi:hypothetical protein
MGLTVTDQVTLPNGINVVSQYLTIHGRFNIDKQQTGYLVRSAIYHYISQNTNHSYMYTTNFETTVAVIDQVDVYGLIYDKIKEDYTLFTDA